MKVVTICGSMRFSKEMQRITFELEKDKGWCVLQCVYEVDSHLSKETLQNLEKAHLKRIDISDAIYVLNIGGYIGSSTRNEINYAQNHNKEVIYHEKHN